MKCRSRQTKYQSEKLGIKRLTECQKKDRLSMNRESIKVMQLSTTRQGKYQSEQLSIKATS